jgi:hypothetical protein
MKSRRNAYVKEVIISEETIGRGEDGSPVRTLIVVRDKDGKVIAEHDPLTENLQESNEMNTTIDNILCDFIQKSTAIDSDKKLDASAKRNIKSEQVRDFRTEILNLFFSFGD